MYTDRFGYLPRQFTAEWSGGTVEPAPEFGGARQWVEENTARDNFLYPWHYWEAHGRTGPPQSLRDALMLRLPVSHTIQMPDAEENREAQRKGLAGFVMHFLGFLFGYRCQFEDWWVDRRVQMRSDTDASPHPTHASHFLQTAVDTWSGWDDRARRLATNSLFFNLRAPGYEWEWERFQASYQVTDAGWRLACETDQVIVQKRPGQERRFWILCDQLGLHWDEDLVEEVVRLRNGLFHEALWDGEHPLEAGDRELFHMDIYLRNFNVRLFLALLGVESDFIHYAWKNLGPVFLKPAEG